MSKLEEQECIVCGELFKPKTRRQRRCQKHILTIKNKTIEEMNKAWVDRKVGPKKPQSIINPAFKHGFRFG